MSAVFFDLPGRTPLQALSATIDKHSLISVVVTSFNTAEYLGAALGSILAQRTSHLVELVVVDDGSSDHSAQVLCDLAGADNRVRPFLLPRNLGTYRARNIGISISRGELITFMDSDDISLPDRLDAQARLLRRPELIASTCNYMRVDTDGRTIPMGGLTERQALASLMFKRQVLTDIGWFDAVRTSADDEFFERIRFVYGRDAHQNVPVLLYRALHRNDSLSNNARTPMLLGVPQYGEMLSLPRRRYVSAYRSWHKSLKLRDRRPYMPFNITHCRPFPAPAELLLREDSPVAANSDGLPASFDPSTNASQGRRNPP